MTRNQGSIRQQVKTECLASQFCLCEQIGKVIDLCYDDDDSHPERWSWARWTTVYLLTPVPADIPYVLPSYPREPGS